MYSKEEGVGVGTKSIKYKVCARKDVHRGRRFKTSTSTECLLKGGREVETCMFNVTVNNSPLLGKNLRPACKQTD
jgi:hypothetical protein